MSTWSKSAVNSRPRILELLEPTRSPIEERLDRLLLDLIDAGLSEGDRILLAYILSRIPIGRSLLKRAKILRPSLIVYGEAIEVEEILETLDDGLILAEMFEDEEFGHNPAINHSKHCGGYAVDSAFERLIEMAKRLERMRTLPRPERERIRVVRKCLEKEREMERYAKKRNADTKFPDPGAEACPSTG